MSWILFKVIAPIVVIGILVFIHELGHFLVAKWCGVGVIRFAVGFGPALCKFRRGETEYQIGIIPLGGFVRMVGDMPDPITGSQASDDAVRTGDEEKLVESEDHGDLPEEVKAMLLDRRRWFIEKSLGARASVVFAGPLANLLLSIVIVWGLASAYGVIDPARTPPKIGGIAVGSPAEKSGLLVDDLVKSVDGRELASWQDLAKTVNGGTGAAIALKVVRGNDTLDISLIPEGKEVTAPTGERTTAYFMGVSQALVRQPIGIGGAFLHSLNWTKVHVELTLEGIWGMLRGRVSTDDLAGPVHIFGLAGESAQQGIESVLSLMAFLSISLAVLNLLPIPILDGGHLLFFFVEALIGPISMKKKEIAQGVGFAVLLLLMGVALKNDIFRITGSKKVATDGPAPAEENGAAPTESAPSGGK